MHRRVLKNLRHFFYEDDMDFDETAESAVAKRNLLLILQSHAEKVTPRRVGVMKKKQKKKVEASM